MADIIKEKYEESKKIVPLLKDRAEAIRRLDKFKGAEEIVSKHLDDALKGVSIRIDAGKTLDLPSLAWLLDEATKEDKDMFSTINDNYINSFTGYGYEDLNLQEGFRNEGSNKDFSLEGHIKDADVINKISPTFFIDAKPIVTREDVFSVVELAESAEVGELQKMAERGFLDDALDIGVDQTRISEAETDDVEFDEKVTFGLEAHVDTKLKELKYVPEENAVSKSSVASGTASTFSSNVTSDGGSEGGTASNYTGEFPKSVPSGLGKLQDSKKANILAGYPPQIRALGDLVSRAEGTHETFGYKGYGEFSGYNEKGRALMQRSLKGEIGHPTNYNGTRGASSAAGRYQAMGKTGPDTWRRTNKKLGKKGFDGQGDEAMTVKNQDEFFVQKLKDRGLYDATMRADWSSVINNIGIAQEWASFPVNNFNRKGYYSGQGAKGTRPEYIEALKHLYKFYTGASATPSGSDKKFDGTSGEREAISQETNHIINTGHNRRDNVLRAGAPKMLDTETNMPLYQLNYPLEHYNMFQSTLSPDNQFKGMSFEFVKALTGNTFLLKSNTKTVRYVIVRVTGMRSPRMKFKVSTPIQVDDVHSSNNGKNHTFEVGYGSNTEKLVQNYKPGARDVTETQSTGQEEQVFAIEARNMAGTWLNGVKSIRPVGTMKKSSDSNYVVEVEDLTFEGVYVTKGLIGFGAGFPKDGSTTKEVERAKKLDAGIWGYQSGALVELQGGLRFKKRESLDPKWLKSLKSTFGQEQKQSEIITHEKRMNPLDENGKNTLVVVGNVYTANSKPMLTVKHVKKTAHKKSIGRCAQYVRIAMQKAGYKFTSQASAYMYHTNGTMKTAGFVQIPVSSTLMPGDILVVKNMPGHPHGHIQVYLGEEGKWASDFFHGNKIYHKISNSSYYVALYRDKDFINVTGVKPLSHNNWETLDKLGKGAATSVTVSGDIPTEDYLAETKRLGVYEDLSSYTKEQIEGHRYEEIYTGPDDGFTVYGERAKREAHIKKFMHNFEKGLDLCFPVVKAYTVLGNEDDEPYVEGLPLNPSIYYELPPIQSFNLETNNDYNPLDVCVFSCINPSGTRTEVHHMTDIGLNEVPDLLGTQWFNPKVAQRLRLTAGMKIHIRAGYSNDPNKLIPVFNGIVKEVSGAKDFMVNCVCESYSAELLAQQLGAAEPQDFAGDHNASTGLLLAYSLLNENINHFGARLGSHHLVTPALSRSIAGTASLLFHVVNPFALAIKVAGWVPGVQQTSLWKFASKYTGQSLTQSAEDSDKTELRGYKEYDDVDGIVYADLQGRDKDLADILYKGSQGDMRDPENKALIAPFAAGNGFLWNMFNLSRGNLRQRVFMNIYSATIEKGHGEFRDDGSTRWSALVSFNRKMFYKFYVLRSTVWTVIKEMEYRHPGTLAKPLWYEDRMTLFYGTKEQCYIARDLDPFFMVRSGIAAHGDKGTNKPYVDFYLKERNKRFEAATGFHLLSTKTNIISSNISINRSFATKVNTVYYESKWQGGMEGFNEDAETILLDKTLSKFDIKEKTIALGGIHGEYMAWVYGTQELKRELETMYGGHIIVTGDPTIKAGDYAFFSDSGKGITGTIKIRECSHHFSPETGYTTIIKPGLFVEATHFMWDTYFLKMNLACNFLDLKLKFSQDKLMQGNQQFEMYSDLLTLIKKHREHSLKDYLPTFGAAILTGVFLGAGTATLRLLMNTTRLGKARFYTKMGWSYAKSAGNLAWNTGKDLTRKFGARAAQANINVIQGMAKNAHRNAATRITSRVVTGVSNITKAGWNKTIGVRGLLNRSVGLLWRLVMLTGKAIIAHPLVALVAAVLGTLFSWATSKVRKMKLLHNPITFFPLNRNGQPMVGGISEFSGKGEWDAAIHHFKRNVKALKHAGRILEKLTTDVNNQSAFGSVGWLSQKPYDWFFSDENDGFNNSVKPALDHLSGNSGDGEEEKEGAPVT